ncbi:MAG: hypothetical protein H6760_04235 [Candidatus Nomurabacteria bacterium]|nr:MAG: hypothetical protein H6760_04235 [Candidatus Nomurabacteria bacterium]
MQASRNLYALPIREMTDVQLLREFRKVLRWHVLSHGVGAAVTWLADADQARVSTGIEAALKKQIDCYGDSATLPEIFSLLTSPPRLSFAAQEEREFLQITDQLRRSAKVRNHLLRSPIAKAEKGLAEVDQKVAALLRAHYEKWRWIPYAYKGPAYSFRYFLTRWRELLKSGESPKQILADMKVKERLLKQKQARLKKSLHLQGNIWQLIRMGQEIVYIKEFRKGALYHGMYCYEPFFREIAQRHKLTLETVRALNSWEIEDLLQGKSIPTMKELLARTRETVAYCDKKQYIVLTGQKAKKFMKEIPKEDTLITTEASELTGSCASPGAASGTVKIIEVPADIPKMKKGDILVSETTYPSLVPAMKLAAAIVTNAGGLTSHAAIVSRELGVPCVVGTKVANKILKDGDKVEVDATKGLVRKL